MKNEPVLKIADLRKDKGISQKELAEKLGVAQTTISSWETGARKPDINTIMELCKIFGTTLDFVIDNDELFPNLSEKEKEDIALHNEQIKKLFDFINILPKDKIERIFEVTKAIFPEYADIKSSEPDGEKDIKEFLDKDFSSLANLPSDKT